MSLKRQQGDSGVKKAICGIPKEGVCAEKRARPTCHIFECYISPLSFSLLRPSALQHERQIIIIFLGEAQEAAFSPRITHVRPISLVLAYESQAGRPDL